MANVFDTAARVGADRNDEQPAPAMGAALGAVETHEQYVATDEQIAAAAENIRRVSRETHEEFARRAAERDFAARVKVFGNAVEGPSEIPQDRSPVAAARRVAQAETDAADARGAMQINVMAESMRQGGRRLWDASDFRRLRVMLQVLNQTTLGQDAQAFAGSSIDGVQAKFDATLNAVAVALGVVPKE